MWEREECGRITWIISKFTSYQQWTPHTYTPENQQDYPMEVLPGPSPENAQPEEIPIVLTGTQEAPQDTVPADLPPVTPTTVTTYSE